MDLIARFSLRSADSEPPRDQRDVVICRMRMETHLVDRTAFVCFLEEASPLPGALNCVVGDFLFHRCANVVSGRFLAISRWQTYFGAKLMGRLCRVLSLQTQLLAGFLSLPLPKDGSGSTTLSSDKSKARGTEHAEQARGPPAIPVAGSDLVFLPFVDVSTQPDCEMMAKWTGLLASEVAANHQSAVRGFLYYTRGENWVLVRSRREKDVTARLQAEERKAPAQRQEEGADADAGADTGADAGAGAGAVVGIEAQPRAALW